MWRGCFDCGKVFMVGGGGWNSSVDVLDNEYSCNECLCNYWGNYCEKVCKVNLG